MNKNGKCCLCGGDYDNIGNNPFPFNQNDIEARCCTLCDRTKVIPARILMLKIKNAQFTGDFEADTKKLWQVFEEAKYQAIQSLDIFVNLEAGK